MILFYAEHTAESTVYKKREIDNVKFIKKILTYDFDTLVSDLLVLADGHEIKRIFDNPKGAKERTEAIQDLSHDFLTYSVRKKVYDEILLIDLNGMEIIKVEYRGGQPFIVPVEKLRNRKDRDYFKETVNINPNETYITPFDLNLEQGEKEHSVNGSIRLGTPVKGSKGIKKGILVLNYSGSRMLDNIKQTLTHSIGQRMLLDPDGHRIYGSDSDADWGKDKTFGKVFPNVWTNIIDRKEGQLTTEKGVFTFATVYPLLWSEEPNSERLGLYHSPVKSNGEKKYYWKIVSYIPHKVLSAKLLALNKWLIGIYTGLILLLCLGAKLSKISDEKQIGEEELIKNQSLLQSILDNTSAIIYLKDRDRKYILVNHMFELLFHVRKEEITGKSDLDFFPWDMAEKLGKNDLKVLNGGYPITVEEVMQQEDGIHTYISIKFPLFDSEGNVYSVCGISTDITDRKKIEKRMKKFNEELEKLVSLRTSQLESTNKDLESFCYSVSHDLRAPLRFISCFTSLLKKQTDFFKSDEKVRLYINKILESSEFMGVLIDDLLNLSRLGRKKMEKTTVHMNEILQEIKMGFELEYKEINILWEIDPLEDLEGDPTLFRQLWTNFISNAIKYTKKGEDVNIDIGCNRDENENIVYYIRDKGIGFDMKYVDKIFEVFQRLEVSDEYAGTGIGLALVKRIIKLHRGKIWAEGKPEQGATFYFMIPQ